MLTPFNQNWRTSLLPFSLALKNTVSTGVSFTTPSGAIANSQRWASAGFRGFGPVMTFPGAGMDGLGCKCNGGLGQTDSTGLFSGTWGFPEWAIIGIAGYALVAMFLTTKRGVSSVKECVRSCRRG